MPHLVLLLIFLLSQSAYCEVDYSDELPRIPHKTPEEALSTFDVAPGFKIEQAASEPQVVDPIAMSFDADGRLYVVEMRGYSEQEDLNLGRIRLLEDNDHDGRFETSTVFVDGLSWPTAVITYDGGIFVGAAPNIHYFKDTDGDRKANEKRIVFTGFGRSNVQGLLNSFRWGIDNRIHGATSSSGGEVRQPDAPENTAINLRGRDFSFDPKTLNLRAEPGGAQHGLSFDDWGRKFVCSNSDHLQMVRYDDRYAARNPYVQAPPVRISIADDGGQAPVFRSSPVEPWRIVRTRLRVAGTVRGPVEGGGKPAGYFTGSTGVTIYRGDAWPEKFHGLAIIGDVGSNIVHRKKLTQKGIDFVGTRMDEKSEFVRSSDIWFRPAQYANGPDGSLYIMDMYREVIEHPKSLPPMIKKHLDLTSGRDRGRIYRVVAESSVKQAERPAQLSKLSTAELVPLLAHPNGWQRDAASRLIYERGDISVRTALLKMVLESDSPLGRLHAMYALQGLKQLTPEAVASALTAKQPMLKVHALKLSEQFPNDPAIRVKLDELLNDKSVLVQFQLAMTLGEFPLAYRVPRLVQILESSDDDMVRFAVLTSLSSGSGDVLAQLVSDKGFLEAPQASATLSGLAQLIGRQGADEEVASFISTLPQAPEALRSKLFETFLVANSKSQNALSKDLAGNSSKLNELLSSITKKATQIAQDDDAPVEQRVSQIRTLAVAESPATQQLLLKLISYQEPPEVQMAAMETLTQFKDAGIIEELISRWDSLGPQLRQESQELILGHPVWAATFLTATLNKKIPLGQLNRNRLQLLKTSADEQIQKLAEQLLDQYGSSPRSEIVDAYRSALTSEGDVAVGKKLFVKNCSVCHRLEGAGYEIGPNLATFKTRGKEAILLNVLDPNREVNPNFLSYVVATTQGQTHTGMLANQSATTITLKRQENKTTDIQRVDIDIIKSSGLSLMPEGLEKEISPEQMADLFAYLMQVE